MNYAITRSCEQQRNWVGKNFWAAVPKAFASFLVTAGVLFALGTSAQAQHPVVGVWDFSISGSAVGTGVIEFFDDGSLNGLRIAAPPRLPSNPSAPSSNPRGGTPSGVDLRTGVLNEPIGGNGSTTNQNFFGGALIEGSWTVDGTGAVIGFFSELSELLEGDELVAHTNAVSFRAVLKSNRLTIRTFSNEGKLLYKGVRSGAAPDLTGFFTAQGNKKGQMFVEFFSLTPTAIPNIYELSGNGPSYTLTGLAIVTATGAISIQPTRGDGSFLSLNGTYNRRRNIGTLRGQSSDNVGVSYRIVRQ